ncbi:MAG: Fe-S cluster assembly protein SufD [Nitrospirae bacterium]|nr:Fe-S cluster assembly protein SufD [Nitrospirota bacterium]
MDRHEIEAWMDRRREPEWLRRLRLEAFEAYERTPLPALQEEEWRRTDARRIPLGRVVLNGFRDGALHEEHTSGHPAGVAAYLESGPRRTGAWMETAYSKRGLILTDMELALREHADLMRPHLEGSALSLERDKFAALHAAVWHGGWFLRVPEGERIEQPIWVRSWLPRSHRFAGPRTLIVAERRSRVIVIEERESEPGADAAFHCPGVEIVCGESAEVVVVTIDRRGDDVWDVSHERARVGASASLTWIVLHLGTLARKTFLETSLEGAGAEARMVGLSLLDGVRQSDVVSTFHHGAPRTRGDIVFGGVSRDRGRSVYRGRIVVPRHARGTDSHLTHRVLLMSPDARAESIPILEIEANDVKCKHAASQGAIDPDQLFYLMSRGLPRVEAERTLALAFVEDLIGRAPAGWVQERLRERVAERFNR